MAGVDTGTDYNEYYTLVTKFTSLHNVHAIEMVRVLVCESPFSVVYITCINHRFTIYCDKLRFLTTWGIR